jgi:hypothetical protein
MILETETLVFAKATVTTASRTNNPKNTLFVHWLRVQARQPQSKHWVVHPAL